MIPMTAALAGQTDELDRLGKTRDDAMQVSRSVGELLSAIALAHKAKLIVEVGTSYGFSGLWWSAALAVTSGHLHTLDVSEKKFSSSKATFASAGVTERVTNHIGNTRETLADISGQIDIVFIDADKPSTQTYFDILWPKVRVGGGVVTDNVLSHEKEMGPYVKGLRARDDAHSVTIPLRAGLEWTVKLR